MEYQEISCIKHVRNNVLMVELYVYQVNCHLVYNRLVYYPFCLLNLAKLTFNALGLGSKIRVKG